MHKLELEILTPQQQVIAATVKSVTLPGCEGELGILPSHLPILTRIVSGPVLYTTDNAKQVIAVHGGHAVVIHNQVTILAESAETAENIDVDRARDAEQRASQALIASGTEEQQAELEKDIKRAKTRQFVAKLRS